mgnify:CR=1 FL=1
MSDTFLLMFKKIKVFNLIHQQGVRHLVMSMLLVFFISGCYTVLMTTKDAPLASRRSSSTNTRIAGGNFASTLDYNQNCFSCHSQVELDDRDFDMTRSGVNIVHGIPYSAMLWASSGRNSIENDPYGWRRPAESLPWWVPPAASTPSTGGTSSSAESGNRRRESGSTRGGEAPRRERDTTPVASPTPTAPPTSTPTPAPAVQPAVSTTPSVTPPPSTPPAQQEGTRSRTTSSDGPTRKSGSTRGEDKP